MTDALTAFDAVAISLIILSALMALARGFVRELATLGAFICALASAYYARKETQLLQSRQVSFLSNFFANIYF